MNPRPTVGALIVVLVSGLSLPRRVIAESAVDPPRPVLVQLDPSTTEYVHVLGDSPATVSMRSGFVTLLPAQAVGRHSTKTYEEAVIVFSGQGEMRLADGTVLALRPYSVAYCPPGTEHDVANTGTEPLRYVYVVAQAFADPTPPVTQQGDAPDSPR